MANILDQIGQRNVVRVVSNGVPSSLENLTDVDFSGISVLVPFLYGMVLSSPLK